MNMKSGEKFNAVRRVFVSIREQAEKKQDCVRSSVSKPPTQPARFIRKRKEVSRSRTPDQAVNNPTVNVAMQEPSFRRSLSPFNVPYKKEGIPYFKPKETQPLLASSGIEKEDSLCMPYELSDMEKQRTKPVKASIRTLGSYIDLKKGSFSKKQIISDPNFQSRRGGTVSRLFASSGMQVCDESTTVPSRTPSPLLPPRNNRCNALSKNFTINKQHMASEINKQIREHSAEKENENLEELWQSILKS